jgi:RNA polymerase subunit RPABC4/transcription elongation factor Spt4
MEIPEGIFDLFDEGVTAMLASSMAASCVLVYPPRRTECPNCVVNPLTGSSSGRYKAAGPIVFTHGQVCPYCQGNGFTNTETTETVKMLIDWEPKPYINVMKSKDDNSVALPGSIIKIQAAISCINSLRQCTEIRIHQGVSDLGYWRYERTGEPIPYGLNHNSFCSCVLTRVG